MQNSQDITLEGNVVHDFIQHGIYASKSSRLTIHNNVVNGVKPEIEEFPDYTTWVGEHGGIEVSDSSNYVITDNIIASAWASGVRLPARSCGSPAIHTGNVAHSIAGYGVIVMESSAGSCAEFSDFKAYKTRMGGIHMGGSVGSSTNKLNNVVAVDCNSGIMAFGSGGGHIEVSDSVIIGG